MSERRDWCQLSEAEKAEAIATANDLISRGATRWHAIARMCGLRSGIALRKALDPDWYEQQKAIDRERSRLKRQGAPVRTFDRTPTQRARHAERGRASGRVAAMMSMAGKRGAFIGLLNTPGTGPITLPRVKFLED